MEKRLITVKQEEAFRLCHQDFEGLTETEAAERMGVTQATISEHLANVKKIAPQLFPIMTKQQAKCYHHLTVDGWSPQEIADHLGISVNAVYLTFRSYKGKGLAFPGPRGNVLQYEEWMDDIVKERY